MYLKASKLRIKNFESNELFLAPTIASILNNSMELFS